MKKLKITKVIASSFADFLFLSYTVDGGKAEYNFAKPVIYVYHFFAGEVSWKTMYSLLGWKS